EALLTGAGDKIADAGAKLEEAHPAVDFATQLAAFNHLIVAAISASLPDEYSDAASGSHLAWLRVDKERARLRRIWAEWFTDFDALLCPVMPAPALRHDHDGDMMTRTVEINGETRM